MTDPDLYRQLLAERFPDDGRLRIEQARPTFLPPKPPLVVAGRVVRKEDPAEQQHRRRVLLEETEPRR